VTAGDGFADRGLGTSRQAAARRDPQAVQLAGNRTGRADQPGSGRARAQTRDEGRQDAVLEGTEWRKLLKSIPDVTLRDLRDRALIASCASTRPRR